MDMSFNERVYEAVRRIPKGKVATYGQIAFSAGSPGAARAVGNALHKNPDQKNIPCHRVVSRKGLPAPDFAFGGADAQLLLLEREGVHSRNGKIDLSWYLWNPAET